MCGAMATFGVWLCQSGQMRWDFTCSLREKMLPENFFMKQSSCKEIEEERVRSERIDR